MSEHTFPSITGYTLTALLYTGSRTAVYRAEGDSQAGSVVIKVLRSPSPSCNELVRFRNQYIIAKNLNSSKIVKPLALVPWQNSYALVMEDVGGISLRSYLQTHKRLSVEQLMNIALQMADSLQHLSQHQVLHKDINPANILIHPETYQVWLTDFSLASLLPKESQELRSPGSLEGTLAYIAPEQTGRMNRGINYRTDFYSLGVTLYELLTGELPFQSDDPIELIHSHIAKVPVPPCNVGSRTLAVRNPIPNSLSDIVLKLMAKNAEDRYQSTLGLKHDLQQCLSQWEASGQIESFELGMQDRCDRFLIPEKLYGREAEVKSLLDAFERISQGASELMLVAGYSGVGKTAVVNEVHKPIVQKRGYFVKGKYDQFNRNIPFSALVQAFRDLMGQLLGESNAQLQTWKAKILKSLGDNGQVLIDVIPELEAIIGTQPPILELSGSAAQNRFNLLFEKFIPIFTTQDHPLVMFLDDLQWVDSASLNLLKVIMGDPQRGYLLLLGAYRDNEVFPTHPLMVALEELEKQKVNLSTITLPPLSASHINQLVAETLSCTVETAAPLTDLVYQKTSGNPFFATQFLKGLYEGGLITFETDLGYWECDLVQVQQVALTDDVLELMARWLYKLPQKTQNILKLAACIGNQFDLETLAIIGEKPLEDVAADLWSALKAGLVLPQSQSYKFFQEWKKDEKNLEGLTVGYRFLHDRVQQAAYALIPDSEKAHTHYKIGQQLVQEIPLSDQPNHIFAIVGQLNRGIAIISTQAERDNLAELNLKAYQRATSTIAFRSSYKYAQTGLSLLDNSSAWQRQYDLTLALHNAVSSSALLCSEFNVMDTTVATTVHKSKSLLEQIPAYLVLIHSKVFRNQRYEAVEIGLEVLKKLGVNIPFPPSQTDVEQQLKQVVQLIEKQPIPNLLYLPRMTDEITIAVMEVATAIIPSAYTIVPPLCPILIALIVEQSIQYGNTKASAYAYSTYSFVSCHILKNIEAGKQFGQLAQAIINRLDAQAFESSIAYSVGVLTLHRYAHIRETFPLLRKGYTTGLKVGDLESAGICGQLLCQHLFFSGEALESWISEAKHYYDSLTHFHQVTAAYIDVTINAVLSLQGHSPSPILVAEDKDQELSVLASLESVPDRLGLSYLNIQKLWLCYLFEELEPARNCANSLRNCLSYIAGLVAEGEFLFLDSLTAIASFICTDEKDNLTILLNRVNTNQQALIQDWANHAPMNYQHKVDLVNAEKHRILGQKLKAIDCYELAIAGAKENAYIQEEALANELAAKFYLDWGFDSAQPNGKEKIAAVYMQEAYLCYQRWGAKVKTDDLETRYASLLEPILKQTNRIDLLATLHSIAPLSLSVHPSGSSSQPTTDSFNTVLDLATIFKSAQALSESIGLSELLKKLAPMMLQTSGAERLALLLPDRDADWQIRVTATAETTQFVSDPLTDDNPDLPVQLLQYVQRTQKALVVDGLSQALPVVDLYLQYHPHRSVLCLPLLHQTKLIGLLYLEHHSVAGLFCRDRITVLNFLCAQAAISLENALLNQTLEQKLETQITKRQASENRLHNMVDNIPGVVYQACFNADGTDSLSYISPNCHGLYGVTAEDMMSGHCSLRDFEHSEDSPIIDQILTDANQTLQPFDHQFRIITPSGTLKWVHAIARPSPQPDNSTIWDGVVMDVSDRKQVERALQVSEAHANAAFEQAEVGIVEGSFVDGKITRTNNCFCQMTGYIDQELKSLAIENLTHPEDLSDFQYRIKQLHLGEIDSFTVEKRCISKDQSYFWVNTTVSLIQNPEETSPHWFAVVQDISDRKAAELALEDAQAQFHRLTENVPGMLYRCVQHPDGSDEMTYVSSQVREIFELAPETVLEDGGRPMRERTHPDDIARIEADIQTSAKTLQPLKNEHRLVLPEKGLRWIQAIAQPECLKNGDVVWDGVVIDISDRKQVEQQLQELSERLELAVESAQLGIWVWDHQDNHLTWNDRMFEIYAVPPEEFRGTYENWANRIHPEDLVQLEAQTPDSVSGSANTYTQEFRVIRPDDTIRYIFATATIQRDNQRQPLRSVGMNIDMTDRKTAEAKLQCTNAELLRATQHKSEFLASMSHELRTPLNAVLGYSQLMQRNPSFPIEHREQLDAINRNGEHLLALINNILEMSKIEAGKITLDPSQVELPEFLDDIYQTFIIKAKAKKIDLQLVYPPKITRYIQVDAIKLRQIIFNLMSNALKFTQEGQVCLQAQVVDVLHEYPHKKAHLQFSVSDTGSGIADEDLETIFEPFIQSETGKQHYQGTGLGLSISRKFAQMMGGNLRASSTLGQGSTFLCDIYVQVVSPSNDADNGQEHHYHNVAGLKNQQLTYRLLIVDDNADNRDFLAQLLSIPGFEVRQAIDGSQAVELNESWQPHLICMDINMPHMDGLEATRLIRNSCTVPKIIAITASAFADDQQIALEAGCDDFLAKPFTSDKLFKQIATHLDVEFIQAEAAEPMTPSLLTVTPFESIESVIKAGVKMMPVSWQKDLKQSILTLDEQSMQELLTDVPIENREMADAISSLLYDFRFDVLINILEEI